MICLPFALALNFTFTKDLRTMSCSGGNYYGLHIEARVQLNGLPWPVASRDHGTPGKTVQDRIWAKNTRRQNTQVICISRNSSPIDKIPMTESTWRLLLRIQWYCHLVKRPGMIKYLLNFVIPFIAMSGNFNFLWTTNRKTDIIGRPPLTCSKKSASDACEHNARQNIDKGHWNTKMLIPYHDEIIPHISLDKFLSAEQEFKLQHLAQYANR